MKGFQEGALGSPPPVSCQSGKLPTMRCPIFSKEGGGEGEIVSSFLQVGGLSTHVAKLQKEAPTGASACLPTDGGSSDWEGTFSERGHRKERMSLLPLQSGGFPPMCFTIEKRLP